MPIRSTAKMDAITAEHISEFVAFLQSKQRKVSSINSALRAVRRVFRLALKWELILKMSEISLLRGENHRDHVVTRQEEAKYLAAAREPLASIATVLVDTGLRPDECFRLRWEDVSFEAAHNGRLRVTSGKTAAARRTIPRRCESANFSNHDGRVHRNRLKVGCSPPDKAGSRVARFDSRSA